MGKNNLPENTPPKLTRRGRIENRKSYIRSGRTIGEKRERLETASERLAAHKKIKRATISRTVIMILGFLAVIAAITGIAILFSTGHRPDEDGNTATSTIVTVPFSPTVEVIDEDIGSGTSHITARMKEYIGQAEADFRELGYRPVKVVIPSGAIREVDFYLADHSGFIKLIIDRETGISVEDADRMIRYLEGQGITDYQYIDVRLDGKAYWK